MIDQKRERHFNEMVESAKRQIQREQDFERDHTLVWAHEEITRLRAQLAEVEGQEAVAEVREAPDLFPPRHFVHPLVRLEAGTKLYTRPAPVKVPDGYALVPVEPTDEMLDAALACHHGKVYPQYMTVGPRAMRRAEWKAMLKSQGGE